MPGSTQIRHLVLMFDGTWNERHNLTNVARMFEAVDDYKPDKDDEVDPDAGPLQLVNYLKGVGTNFFGSLVGGAFGYGLSDIIKEGYRWLSNNYRVGDKIFVFGFSRGAYSARSLVSLVHLCGGVLMLKPDELEREIDDAVLTEAYDLYRGYVPESPTDARANAANAACKKQLKTFGDKYCQHVSITMLGVWDTVGALGIPDSALKIPLLKPLFNALDPIFLWSRKHYEFHGQGLPCIVEHAYHALAIDEHRADFKPTLWENRKPENKDVKQVWFVGSHCNVGGGATNDDENPDDLWQYSYIWMQNKASKLGLRFYWTYGPAKVADSQKPAKSLKLVPAPSGNIKDRRRISKTVPQNSHRQMLGDGYFAKLSPPVDREVIRTKGASLHWSVKERIEQDTRYQPTNLPIRGSNEYSKISDESLPIETCSCKPNSLHQTGAASNGRPTKKQL